MLFFFSSSLTLRQNKLEWHYVVSWNTCSWNVDSWSVTLWNAFNTRLFMEFICSWNDTFMNSYIHERKKDGSIGNLSWGLYYKTFYGSNCCRIVIS